MKQRLVLILVVLGLSLALDQVTKVWARKTLKGQPAVVLVDGYLDLEYHENPGSAFGLLRNVPGARYILIGVGFLALFVVWRMVRNAERYQRVADVAFGLVAGGALGNVVDRILIGRVSDFVLMHFHRKYVWPAYNVADAALVVGVILLVLVLGRKREQAAPAGKRGRKGR